MDEITVGQLRNLKAKEQMIFNGLKWLVASNVRCPKAIESAGTELKSVRNEIKCIESEIRYSLQNKKTIAQATA